MRVAFRVDASRQIGTGHLRRSLSLAHALNAIGADIRFVKRDLGAASEDLIRANGFEDIVILPAPSGAFEADPAIPHSAWAEVTCEQDVEDTTGALSDFAPDWVVIDSYAFDAGWHNGVREALGCKIAQIDEVPDRKLAPDVLIDHTHAADHRAKFSDCLANDAAILGGPRYALLGPAFAEAERYTFHETVRSVGVFLGGVDSDNCSAVVLEALDAAGFEGEIEIVATTANPHLESLKELANSRAKTRVSIDLPDLAEFFARHDLQIGAGGGATWERCCIGAPSLLVVLAENQNEVALKLAEEGIAAFAAQPSREVIAQSAARLIADPRQREEMAKRSRDLVDGRGALRVVLSMAADGLSVRPATQDDAQMMFDWRGSETTRSVSLETNELVWADHLAWMKRVLADPSRHLMVGMIGTRPVGVIRFDFSDASVAEVSLYLDPALHGLGLGPHLLLAGEAMAAPATVEAAVLATNRPSQRLFEGCGYHQTGPDSWVKHRLPSQTKST